MRLLCEGKFTRIPSEHYLDSEFAKDVIFIVTLRFRKPQPDIMANHGRLAWAARSKPIRKTSPWLTAVPLGKAVRWIRPRIRKCDYTISVLPAWRTAKLSYFPKQSLIPWQLSERTTASFQKTGDSFEPRPRRRRLAAWRCYRPPQTRARSPGKRSRPPRLALGIKGAEGGLGGIANPALANPA